MAAAEVDVVKVREVAESVVVTVTRPIRDKLGWQVGDRVVLTVLETPQGSVLNIRQVNPLPPNHKRRKV